jgi:hypothetical protein
MSVSGVYNNWIKVQNPNTILPQMSSDNIRPPFYFGGSQVPVNLNLDSHNLNKGPATRDGGPPTYSSSLNNIKSISMKGHGLGVGLKTTHNKHDNIRLPKYMFNK